MKNILYLVLAVILFLQLSGCVVKHPHYASVTDVMKVKPGISLDSLNNLLGTGPHDIIARDASMQTIYLYKYRVKELNRVPLFNRKNKGVVSDGKWKDMIVTVSPGDTVLEFTTYREQLESSTKPKTLDKETMIEIVTTVISVTFPALLVYFSLQ